MIRPTRITLHPRKAGERAAGRGTEDLPLTHEEVGLGRRLAVVLLDVLGFVGDHPDERVELQDGDAQVDDVHWVSQKSPQRRCKLCRGGGNQFKQRRLSEPS